MRKSYLFAVVVCLCLLNNSMLAQSETERISSKVKIALRDAANQMLMINGDSTSLILPIKELEKGKFQISFENNIGFEPAQIVGVLKESFQKVSIEEDYVVEVKQCVDQEVAYSYMMSLEEEKTIVPCLDRTLPEQCYYIEVTFSEKEVFMSNGVLLFIVLILVVVSVLVYRFVFKNKSFGVQSEPESEYRMIGGFLFYKDQNKLIKKPDEIVLSTKECELLEIFSDNINHVVKREELTKKVWEDKGVIVGRSLDTYISKLRKKLQSDSNIRIVNIHGVGYKLEVTEKGAKYS